MEDYQSIYMSVYQDFINKNLSDIKTTFTEIYDESVDMYMETLLQSIAYFEIPKDISDQLISIRKQKKLPSFLMSTEFYRIKDLMKANYLMIYYNRALSYYKDVLEQDYFISDERLVKAFASMTAISISDNIWVDAIPSDEELYKRRN